MKGLTQVQVGKQDPLAFTKMAGAGNDFVVIDNRAGRVSDPGAPLGGDPSQNFAVGGSDAGGGAAGAEAAGVAAGGPMDAGFGDAGAPITGGGDIAMGEAPGLGDAVAGGAGGGIGDALAGADAGAIGGDGGDSAGPHLDPSSASRRTSVRASGDPVMSR